MKFNLIAIITLLSFATTSFAILVKMPEEQELRNRLSNFAHFIKKTKIVEKLAGQEKESLGIAMTITLALSDYSKYVKGTPQETAIQMSKPLLFEAVLQDSPEALEELKQHGLYTPIN